MDAVCWKKKERKKAEWMNEKMKRKKEKEYGEIEESSVWSLKYEKKKRYYIEHEGRWYNTYNKYWRTKEITMVWEI